MIINGSYLRSLEPIKNMIFKKEKAHGVSWGMSEVGYDIRVKQYVDWYPPNIKKMMQIIKEADLVEPSYSEYEINKAFFGFTTVTVFNENTGCAESVEKIGRTALASSIEEFRIPDYAWGELRNKSTHARRFFDATLGTDMEPGWNGNLTIEIIFHGNEEVHIPAGSGIAKAVFHELKAIAHYEGKYSNQPDKPIPAILE